MKRFCVYASWFNELLCPSHRFVIMAKILLFCLCYFCQKWGKKLFHLLHYHLPSYMILFHTQQFAHAQCEVRWIFLLPKHLELLFSCLYQCHLIWWRPIWCIYVVCLRCWSMRPMTSHLLCICYCLCTITFSGLLFCWIQKCALIYFTQLIFQSPILHHLCVEDLYNTKSSSSEKTELTG